MNKSDNRSVHVAEGIKTVGVHPAKRSASRVMCAWSAYPANYQSDNQLRSREKGDGHGQMLGRGHVCKYRRVVKDIGSPTQKM